MCYTCTLYENNKKKNLIAPDEYAKWKESHKDNCNRNWWDSSGAMEVEAASRIFGRSIEKYKMRINTMISDGDSKSFKRVTEDKPYGEKYIIKKKECVQHAAKRVGKIFSDIKKGAVPCDEEATTKKGNKSVKRLNAKKSPQKKDIDYMHKYCQKNIKDHDNWQGMQKGMNKTWDHLTSTDDNPKHQNCGDWCLRLKSRK